MKYFKKYTTPIMALVSLLASSFLFQGCSEELGCDVNEFYNFTDALEVDGNDIIEISDVITPRYTSETLLIPEEVAITRIMPENSEMLCQISATELKAVKKGNTFIKVYTANDRIVARIPVMILSDGNDSDDGDDGDDNDGDNTDHPKELVRLVDIPDNQLKMERYDSFQLAEPVNGGSSNDVPKYFKFKSADETIARVSIFGVVSAMTFGSTEIEIFDNDNEYIRTIKVTVVSPVELVNFPDNKLTMEIESTADLVVKPYSYHITTISNTYTFTSSDKSVVEAGLYGELTAVGVGTATITIAEKNSGKLVNTIEVTVRPTLDLTMTTGQQINLKDKLSSEYVLSNLKAEDPSVVKVSISSPIITALKPGKTVITGPKGYIGQKSVYIVVTVKD